jgi:hypothetical protein
MKSILDRMGSGKSLVGYGEKLVSLSRHVIGEFSNGSEACKESVVVNRLDILNQACSIADQATKGKQLENNQGVKKHDPTWYGYLDRIWDYAAMNMPCTCGTDDKWEQTIRGDIDCPECGTRIDVPK